MFKSTLRPSSRRQSSESINKLDDMDGLANLDDQSINLIMNNRDKILTTQNKDSNKVNSNALGNCHKNK